MNPPALRSALAVDTDALEALRGSWARLPLDTYLRDGGRYRFRRHASYMHRPREDVLELVPHRAHWQPVDYNALHGGMERWFAPVEPEVVEAAAWQELITTFGRLFARLRPVDRWFVEAHHQTRTD